MMARRRREKKYTLEALLSGFRNNMPAAGGKFWGILEAFLYQKHIHECILDMFFAQNAPEILKISACGGHFLNPGFKKRSVFENVG